MLPSEPPDPGRQPPPTSSSLQARHFCPGNISDFPLIHAQSNQPLSVVKNPNFCEGRFSQIPSDSSLLLPNPTTNTIPEPNATLDNTHFISIHPPNPPSSPRSKQTSFASLLTSPKEPVLPLRSSYMYKGRPTICYTGAEIDSVCKQYQFALVGKFSQSRPRLEAIRKEFAAMAFHGACTVGLLKPGYIFIHLTVEEDMTALYLKKSMLIVGAPMRIFRWTRHFRFESEPPFAAVWINVPIPPVWTFVPSILHDIACMVGKPLKVDQSTYKKNRWNLARICVELDLTKEPVYDCCIRVDEEDFLINIFYDHVPDYCKKCEHVGHNVETCFGNPNSSWYRPASKPKSTPVHKSSTGVDDISNVQQPPKTAPKPVGKKSELNSMAWIPVGSKNSFKEVKNLPPKSQNNPVIAKAPAADNRFNALNMVEDSADVCDQLHSKDVEDENNRMQDEMRMTVGVVEETPVGMSDEKVTDGDLVEHRWKGQAERKGGEIINVVDVQGVQNKNHTVEGIDTNNQGVHNLVQDVNLDDMKVLWTNDVKVRKKARVPIAKISHNLAKEIKISVNLFDAFLSSLEEKKKSKNVEVSAHENKKKVFENAPTCTVEIDAGHKNLSPRCETNVHAKNGELHKAEEMEGKNNEEECINDTEYANTSSNMTIDVAGTPEGEDVIYGSNIKADFVYVTTRRKKKNKRSSK